MRQILVALVLFGLPALAAAQPGVSAKPAPASPGSIGLRLPEIGLPLAPIGLPLPPIGLPLSANEQRRDINSHPPRPIDSDRSKHGDKSKFHVRTTIVYFGVPYAWDADLRLHAATPGVIVPGFAPPTAQSVIGRLRLEVHPAGALQLYVDGEYVGTADDHGGELEMEAGSRRIEIRAPGFETLVFDAKIIGGRTITYRGSLQPLAPANQRDSAMPPDIAPSATPPEATAPARKQTFYFIPGCYIGNVAPQEVPLPPGCDLSRLITRTP
jgi:hypothetical protein